MRSLLEVDRRPFLTEPPPRRRLARRARWAIALAAGVVLVLALALLITDQVRARDRYGHAHAALRVTQRTTRMVSAQLAEARRDLTVLKTQVGSDTTALNQDSSQLLGAQTSLAAAQAHVTQQASLITSLQTCVVGVEQALNALALNNQSGAIDALNAVSSSCTTAEASSG